MLLARFSAGGTGSLIGVLLWERVLASLGPRRFLGVRSAEKLRHHLCALQGTGLLRHDRTVSHSVEECKDARTKTKRTREGPKRQLNST
ncbi:hypothetical protein L209DRAFT_558928 [Thermothelomyces heterothallicus CBS 203.75]